MKQRDPSSPHRPHPNPPPRRGRGKGGGGGGGGAPALSTRHESREEEPTRGRFAAASLRQVTLGLYLALLALIAVWEAVFAPAGLVPRPVWLALKLAPLLALGYGLWRGGARAHVIAALVVLLYFIEGVVLGFGGMRGLESPATVWYALAETALALGFFVCASLYARVTAQSADRLASAETVS